MYINSSNITTICELLKDNLDEGYRPIAVRTHYGDHGITYGFDPDADEQYAILGFTLNIGQSTNYSPTAFAEIEDGTYGELQGFRIYFGA